VVTEPVGEVEVFDVLLLVHPAAKSAVAVTAMATVLVLLFMSGTSPQWVIGGGVIGTRARDSQATVRLRVKLVSDSRWIAPIYPVTTTLPLIPKWMLQ
jgi:hypothetical protein